MLRQMIRATLCLAACTAGPLALAQTIRADPTGPPPPAISSDHPPVPAYSSALAQQIAALLAAPAVARDHWGIQVTMLDGTPLYSVNEAQLFQPASNNKLFTTAAAMALLGPDRTFETRVRGLLDQATGRIKGPLVLQGAGDADFDSNDIPYLPPASRPKNVLHVPNPLHDLNDLVSQLVAKGVKQIDGDIVGDDTLFPWEPFGANWSIDDAVWGYGAPVSALTIAENQIRLTLAAGTKPGLDGAVTLEQAVPYYTVDGSVATVATKAEATGMRVERIPGSRVLRIYGSMEVGSETDVEQVAIDDPAEYAAMALRAALIQHGIPVTGIARAKHRQMNDAKGFLSTVHQPESSQEVYVKQSLQGGACLMDPPPVHFPGQPLPAAGGTPVLATHRSPPLADDVTLTNKISQNLHAEILLHHLGLAAFCSKGSTVEGARMVREFLLHGGIDSNDFLFYDGSGLSGHDLVTPRAIAKLLAFAATDPTRIGMGSRLPWFAAWKSSLPIGGVDGSLESRFPMPPLKDHVFAKTGTLGEARALSGYLDAASGRTVIFSIMVGNHLPGTSDDREAMDKIVTLIQAAE